MDKLIPSFKNSLFNDDAKSLLTDFTEISIDSILDDGLFKDLPIVGTLVGVTKTAQRLHDRNLLKQTLLFIKEMNNNSIDAHKLNEYKKKLQDNPNYAKDELSRVLLILNSNIDDKKSIHLAKIYKHYIEQKISWDDFCELTEIIMKIFLVDIKLMMDIYNNEIKSISKTDIYKLQRLQSLGLVNLDKMNFPRWSDDGIRTNDDVVVTPLGNKFCHILLNY